MKEKDGLKAPRSKARRTRAPSRDAAGHAPAARHEQFLRSPHDMPVDAPTSSALERALAVLETIIRSDHPLNLQELTDRLELPRQSAHRILQQLLGSAMLQRDVDRDRFSLGPRLRRLARETLYRTRLDGPAHAVLVELAQTTEETCSIGVLDHNHVLLIDRVESHWSLRVHSQVGKRLEVHSSAIGKLLLAHLPRARRHRMITARPLKRFTPYTLATEAELEKDFTRIRRNDYAPSNQGTTLGLYSIAAPIRDPDGRVIAGLSVQMPIVRIDIERVEHDVLPLLRDAVTRLNQLIGEDWRRAEAP